MSERSPPILERRFEIDESESYKNRRALVNRNDSDERRVARRERRYNVLGTLNIDWQSKEGIGGELFDVQTVHDDLGLRFDVDAFVFGFRTLHANRGRKIDGVELPRVDHDFLFDVRVFRADDGVGVVV